MNSVLDTKRPVYGLEELIRNQSVDYSLQAEFYRSTPLFERELELIIATQWLYAGHTSLAAEPGDYFLYEVASESIIIVRDNDNNLNAFANVCRHRGSKVCLEPCGKAKTFVCGYHGWTYGLDGALRSRRYMPADFDPSQFGLKRVNLYVFHGMIFVNLTQTEHEFAKRLQLIDRQLAPFEIGRTKVAERRNYEVEANWKLAVENFLECYHCAPAHPEYARTHTRKAPNEESLDLQRALATRSVECGLAVADSVHEMDVFYDRHALYEGYVSGTKDGKGAAPLLGTLSGYDGGASDISMGPMNYGLIYSDHVVIYAFKPIDVQRCNMEITWLVRADAQAGVDYDVERLVWLWDVTTLADKHIINNNQVGVNSRYYEPGRLSEMESYITAFSNWYLGIIRG